MGIDFGIAITIYIAFNNNNSHYSITSAPIIKSSRKLIKSREDLYQVIDSFNYKTALKVINIAIKHSTSTIQMEDLKGTSFTYNMFYFDLQEINTNLGG